MFYHLEEERECTHHWMKLATTKGVRDIGVMEGKVAKLGKYLFDVRLKESVLKKHLQKAHAENVAVQDQLQKKGKQVATMAYLCMEAIQHRYPSYSYEVYIKEQWLLFQIKTLAFD